MVVRPFLGPEGCCRYPVTCTAFAKQQLRQKPFLTAVYAIFLRLISCNPFTKI